MYMGFFSGLNTGYLRKGCFIMLCFRCEFEVIVIFCVCRKASRYQGLFKSGRGHGLKLKVTYKYAGKI